MILCSISLLAQKKYGKMHSHKRAYQKVNIKKNNYKGPPPWAPAHGYRHRYIYFPQYACYYDNYYGIYYYKTGSFWYKTSLKPSFILNISTAKKVELTIDNEEKPFRFYNKHIIIYR